MELEPGIEGLIHVSEMSWTKKNVHPGKILSTSQEVDVVVLEVDPAKRRISLGLKQTLENPWEAFARNHPVGSTVEGEVKNKTEFGLFIGLDGDVDAWCTSPTSTGTARASRSSRNTSAARWSGRRCSTSTSTRSASRSASSSSSVTRPAMPPASGELRKNAVVTCEVTAIKDGGIEVRLVEAGWTRSSSVPTCRANRDEQRPERFTVGQKVDARVIAYDKKTRKLQVSIKALEIAEEKEAVAQYGSTDSGASLGDILGPRSRSRAATKVVAAPFSTARHQVEKKTRRIAPAGFLFPNRRIRRYRRFRASASAAPSAPCAWPPCPPAAPPRG